MLCFEEELDDAVGVEGDLVEISKAGPLLEILGAAGGICEESQHGFEIIS